MKKRDALLRVGLVAFTAMAAGCAKANPSSTEDSCLRFKTQRACDTRGKTLGAHCAWYACADNCRTIGTDTSEVCPEWSRFPADDTCRENNTLEYCNSAGCAWYACQNMCFRTGTSQSWVCGGFVSADDLK